MTALAVGYLGPTVIGMGRGWHIAPAYFAERYGLVILIALGESIIAIGAGAGFDLSGGMSTAAAFGAVVISALRWLYFDVAAIFARRRLMQAAGLERARLARDAYTYLHLPMVAGIVLFAFGLKTTLHHVDEELHLVPAVALCGGVGLYTIIPTSDRVPRPTPPGRCDEVEESPRFAPSPRRDKVGGLPLAAFCGVGISQPRADGSRQR
jgi:low temperature requirement protein LtrA